MTLQNAKCFTTRQNSHTMKHCFMHEKLQTLHKMEAGEVAQFVTCLCLISPLDLGLRIKIHLKRQGWGNRFVTPVMVRWEEGPCIGLEVH